MGVQITVENIKCGGCATTIRNRLLEEPQVTGVTVDVASGQVAIEAPDDRREALARRLAGLGYPEVGSVEGLKAAGAKAVSFVSCAVGRLDARKQND